MRDEAKTGLLEKLKKSSIEELTKYESAAIAANRIINVIGISLLLLMFIFPIGTIILVSSVSVLLLANMGVNVNRSLIEVRRYLRDPKRVDK